MVERSAADSIFVGNPLVRLNCHLLGEDQFAGGAGALSGVMSGPCFRYNLISLWHR